MYSSKLKNKLRKRTFKKKYSTGRAHYPIIKNKHVKKPLKTLKSTRFLTSMSQRASGKDIVNADMLESPQGDVLITLENDIEVEFDIPSFLSSKNQIIQLDNNLIFPPRHSHLYKQQKNIYDYNTGFKEYSDYIKSKDSPIISHKLSDVVTVDNLLTCYSFINLDGEELSDKIYDEINKLEINKTAHSNISEGKLQMLINFSKDTNQKFINSIIKKLELIKKKINANKIILGLRFSNINLLDIDPLDFLTIRKCFYRTIFNNYNKIDISNNYKIAIIGRSVKGRGDYVTMNKLFLLLTRKLVNFDINMIYPDYKIPCQLFYNNTKDHTENELYWQISNNIYACKNQVDMPLVLKKLTEIDINFDIIINTPTAPEMRSLIDYNLYEYGISTETIDKMSNTYVSGLYPTELGIYIENLEDKITEIDNTNDEYLLYYSDNNKRGNLHFFVNFAYYLYSTINYITKNRIKLFIPGFVLTKTSIDRHIQNMQKGTVSKSIADFYNNITIIETGDKITKMLYKSKEIEIIDTILSNSEFISIINVSSYVGCTGDQSITEVISCNKGFFYEKLEHKTGFFDSILELSSKIPNCKSLYKYLDMHKNLRKYTIQDYYKILQPCLDNKEFQNLNQFIYQHFNIEDSVPGNVKSIIIHKYYPQIFTDECNLFISMLKSKNYRNWYNFFYTKID